MDHFQSFIQLGFISALDVGDCSFSFEMISTSGYTNQSLLLHCCFPHFQFSSVQSLSRVRLFATPWTAARQASLSIPNSRSPPKPISIESVMPSNCLIFCRPLLLLPAISPSIRVFSNKSALRIRWPKYWSFLYTNIITFEVLGTSSNIGFPPHNFRFLTLYLQPWNSFKFHL